VGSPLEDIRKFPDGWWKTTAAARVFSFHLLPHMLQLSISYVSEGRTYRQPSTGLLIDSDGSLMRLTAGHVVDAVGALISDPAIHVLDVRWLDRFPRKDVSTLPVVSRKFSSLSRYSDRQDIGAILLPPLEAANLRNNPNIRPMHVRRAPAGSPNPAEGHILVGFPWEKATLTETPVSATQSNVTLTSDLACLPLELLVSPRTTTQNEFWDDPYAFYARFSDYTDRPRTLPQDLRGMSGGPVFSFYRTNEGSLWITLVAILASYSKSNREIRAEPIDRVIQAIGLWMAGGHT
jgi:hypothetical protein